jgi:hypothetical protein
MTKEEIVSDGGRALSNGGISRAASDDGRSGGSDGGMRMAEELTSMSDGKFGDDAGFDVDAFGE